MTNFAKSKTIINHGKIKTKYVRYVGYQRMER